MHIRLSRPARAIGRRVVCLGSMLAVAMITTASPVGAHHEPNEAAPIVLAQADSDSTQTSNPTANPTERSRPLEPRYQPREPEEKSFYNGSYLFGMTRGVADSTIHPAGKVPLFLLTVPLDIVCLPFAAIGGLFG
jgi:hypothetical protein